jgi:hypothetical protein
MSAENLAAGRHPKTYVSGLRISGTSPTAYLADLLQWLECAPGGAPRPFDVLVGRRPDLLTIALNDTNTRTQVPYIDLVCELLEEAVAIRADARANPDAPTLTATDLTQRRLRRQTTRAAEEIRAYPEHLDLTVYFDVLPQSTDRSVASFDLAAFETNAYLAGAPPTLLVRWAGVRPTAGSATQMRNALRMEMSNADWLEHSTAVQDQLRGYRRDALLKYLLATAGLKDPKTAPDMYGHFLIDVEVEAVVNTSRIAQAISAIQLFVQRCLLGLESALHEEFADDHWREWEWRKNYQSWAAKR